MKKKTEVQPPVVSVKTTKFCEVTLQKEHILAICGLPSDAFDMKVSVYVPGGGDWSNMDLDIDSDSPVTVSYKCRGSDE